MKGYENWLPGDRMLVLAMAKIWIIMFELYGLLWGIPVAVMDALVALVELYQAAIDKVLNKATCTKADRVNCKLIKKQVGAMMADIKARYLKMPPITLQQWVNLLLKEPKTSRDPVDNSKDIVRIIFTHDGPGQVTAHFHLDPGSPGNDERANKTVAYRYKVVKPGEAIPATEKQLDETGQTNADTAFISFGAGNIGNTAYFSACYRSDSGKDGAWSQLYPVVIA